METKQASRKSALAHPKALYRHPGGLIITLLVVLIGGWMALNYLVPKGERINDSGYQVVYLASGQAYFGKLQNTEGSYMVLKNAFTGSDQSNAQDNEQAQTALVKVSDQVYGPEDSLSIKSDQVVFWQNLRDDSKVAQAIKNAR